MKPVKALSLALLAAGLASGAVYAKGGNGGMGGGMGMGNMGMSYPDSAQRKETRTRSRDEKRVQSREQIRTETREQVRSGDAVSAGQ